MIVKTKTQAKKIITDYIKECDLFDLAELVSCIYPNAIVQVGSKAEGYCLRGGRLQELKNGKS
jgi:hypothetical protein